MPKYLSTILILPLLMLLVWGFFILHESSKRQEGLAEIRHQVLETRLRAEVDNTPIDLNSKINFRGEEVWSLNDDEKIMKIYNVKTKEWREESVEKLIAENPARFIRKQKSDLSNYNKPILIVGGYMYIFNKEKRIVSVVNVSSSTNPIKITEFEINDEGKKL